ncbi:hypothetical protein ANANG_G00024330 [Anguilla anguilla]|uniref:Calpain-3 n=1 Tax=Anguilla anguilla TaxID=7936 RepID=A0A9D3N2V9_ANGAN|nr:hypothetical protein ANANG_G00024330 [Anguilla anguilla]
MPYTPAGFFCDRLIRERERRDGEGSLSQPLRFNGQDFSVLKQECVQKKSLFEDDMFQATVESLGYKELGHKSNKVKNIVWKRPKVGGAGASRGGGTGRVEALGLGMAPGGDDELGDEFRRRMGGRGERWEGILEFATWRQQRYTGHRHADRMKRR